MKNLKEYNAFPMGRGLPVKENDEEYKKEIVAAADADGQPDEISRIVLDNRITYFICVYEQEKRITISSPCLEQDLHVEDIEDPGEIPGVVIGKGFENVLLYAKGKLQELMNERV